MHFHSYNRKLLNIIACFRVLLRVRSSVDLNAHLKLKDTRAALDEREESEFGLSKTIAF